MKGTASLAGSGEVLLNVKIRGTFEQDCRRCLEAVRTPVELDSILVFGEPEDEVSGDDGEIRSADLDANELEFGYGVREELLLALDPYVVCRPDCAGLCPVCGVDRNKESCDCTLEDADPRWDALRELKSE